MVEANLGRWMHETAIQLPYHTGCASLLEYADRMEHCDVVWSAVLEGKCPICGKKGCLREITPYGRWVFSLFPLFKRWVLVARFQCRTKKLTVSMLPLELAPYHPFMIPSMLALVFLCVKDGKATTLSGFLGALLDATERESGSDHRSTDDPEAEDVQEDSDQTSLSLLRLWICLLVRGFRRAHTELRVLCVLDEMKSGKGPVGEAREVQAYAVASTARAPPSAELVLEVMREYSARTGKFLFGTPSQDRRAAVGR